MKTVYDFTKGLNLDEWFYCYSPHAKAPRTLIHEDNYVRNGFNEDVKDYDYTTAMLKKKIRVGTRVWAECDFDVMGAPLIIFTNDLMQKENGLITYGVHFEAVAYDKGCNVWFLVPCPEKKEDPTHPTLLCFKEKPLRGGEKIFLAVEVIKGGMIVEVNDMKFTVMHENVPEEFYIGFSACEGINKFYQFGVEEKE